MPTELRWLVSTAASCLHAAQAIASGRVLADRATATALSDEARQLASDLATLGISQERFFQHAIPASVQFDGSARLAEVVTTKLLGPATAAGATQLLTRRLIALAAAFDRANPAALDELELRAGPLCEQWEARGPGLLAAIGRTTEGDLLADQADVILVHPVAGGGGAAHPLYNSVRLEAVLANPIAELPEVVRLGWLLTQLKFDVGRYTDTLPPDRLAQIGPLAMIPPALAAAEEVELVRRGSGTIATALVAWNAPAADAAKLNDWWDTYLASPTAWPVALAALDRMLLADE